MLSGGKGGHCSSRRGVEIPKFKQGNQVRGARLRELNCVVVFRVMYDDLNVEAVFIL